MTGRNMNDLILDDSILHATPIDFWPIQEKGLAAIPACFDLAFGSGHLKLIHAPMQDFVLVTPQFVRIAIPPIVNIERLHEELVVGEPLRNALVELRFAAIIDRGILTACGEVKDQLQSLSERPNNRDAGQEDNESDDPVMKPYDRWWYGVERNSDEIGSGKPQVLAFPISHVNRARERNPNLAINQLYDLLADGLSPVMAKIGVPKHSADYAAARSEWIEIALESLAANIDDAVKRWPALPGEPFQNFVRIDGDLFVITLDTIDGVTVQSTASKQMLEQFTLEAHRVGHVHLAHGLATLRRAAAS